MDIEKDRGLLLFARGKEHRGRKRGGWQARSISVNYSTRYSRLSTIPTHHDSHAAPRQTVGYRIALRSMAGWQVREELGFLIPSQCYTSLDSSVAKFLTLLRSNPGKKVFVHCRLGTDRTGMMIAAYRMSQEGWSAKEARKEMEAFGYSFEHHVICPGLAQYEKDFPHEFATSPEFETLRAAAPPSATPQR